MIELLDDCVRKKVFIVIVFVNKFCPLIDSHDYDTDQYVFILLNIIYPDHEFTRNSYFNRNEYSITATAY